MFGHYVYLDQVRRYAALPWNLNNLCRLDRCAAEWQPRLLMPACHVDAFTSCGLSPRASALPTVLMAQSRCVLAHADDTISGMVVPWLYVGMLFASFCW